MALQELKAFEKNESMPEDGFMGFNDGTEMTKDMSFSTEDQRNVVIGVVDLLRNPQWNPVMLDFLLQDGKISLWNLMVALYISCC